MRWRNVAHSRKQGVWQHMILHDLAIAIEQQHLATISEQAATIAKLPTYADTGEPFVPCLDPFWVLAPQLKAGQPARLMVIANTWTYMCGRFGVGGFYSTRAAAEAAIGGE